MPKVVKLAQKILPVDGAVNPIIKVYAKTELLLVRLQEIALLLVIGNTELALLLPVTHLAFMERASVENANVFLDMEDLPAINPMAVMVFLARESKSTSAGFVVARELLVWAVMELPLVLNMMLVAFVVELDLLVMTCVVTTNALLALIPQRAASGVIRSQNVCVFMTSVFAPKVPENLLTAVPLY